MYINHPLYQNDLDSILSMNINWEKLDNSAILIAGASGMIGTVLIDTLMRRNTKYNSNIKIFALGRSIEHGEARFKDYFGTDLFRFIQCDINHAIPVEEKVDYIFHCASNTHPKAYASDPIGTIITNISGTQNILELARKSETKRIVFLSSVEIYGENTGNVERFTEKDCGYIDCNTVRAGYPEGKRVGEALCQAYISKYGMDIVIPRICRVYGPTMLETDSKALAQFIRNAANKENIVLKSEGTQYFSYCYVADVVSALLYILLSGETGNAYNIADEQSDIHLKDLAQLLASWAGTQVIFQLPDELEKKGFSKATKAVLESSKIKTLGWKPLYNIEKGLERTLLLLNAKTYYEK